MSEVDRIVAISDNEADGFRCYMEGDEGTRDWFARQWATYPTRVDPECTTNLSFLYGGLRAFRMEYRREPDVSHTFAKSVSFFDRARLEREG